MKLVRLLLFLSLIAVLGIFTISATPYVEAYDIPDWVESLAGMWFSGMIDDNTFGTALDWLIDNGVLATPSGSFYQIAFPVGGNGTHNIMLTG